MIFEQSSEDSDGVSQVIWGKNISDRGTSERKQVKGGSMHGGSSLVREAWGRILGDWIGEVTHHVGPCKGCCFSLKSHWRALVRGATGYSFLYLKKKKKITLATVLSIILQLRAEVSSPKLQMSINFNNIN